MRSRDVASSADPNTASGSAKDSCIASGWGTAQGPSSSASIVVRLALFSGKNFSHIIHAYGGKWGEEGCTVCLSQIIVLSNIS